MKVHIVKDTVFPAVMYGCESWTINKAEHWGIDAFELWCWRRLLRVPWTARGYNQSVLKKSVLIIHWKDWCWSWSSNTLATWWKNWLTGKDPDAGKDLRWEKGMTENEMVGWHRQHDGMSLSRLQELVIDKEVCMLHSLGLQRVKHNWATELNWTELNCYSS